MCIAYGKGVVLIKSRWVDYFASTSVLASTSVSIRVRLVQFYSCMQMLNVIDKPALKITFQQNQLSDQILPGKAIGKGSGLRNYRIYQYGTTKMYLILSQNAISCWFSVLIKATLCCCCYCFFSQSFQIVASKMNPWGEGGKYIIIMYPYRLK